MEVHFPIIAIEVVLVFGGVLVFGWWQLRSIKRDQAETAAKEREREAASKTQA